MAYRKQRRRFSGVLVQTLSLNSILLGVYFFKHEQGPFAAVKETRMLIRNDITRINILKCFDQSCPIQLFILLSTFLSASFAD